MSAVRLQANHLGKRFRRYAGAGVKRWRFWSRRDGSAGTFWALRGVSLEVRSGEMLGVIGHNGAGKSTLLHLLGGVGRPTEGRMRVHGRIGALLDLGGGFVGDLTGRENAILAGVMAGLTRREVLERFDAMVQFAELEEFIDQPVRTYSTGMAMRLAFSVAIHTDPEVMLIDEFLSVGDLAFQAKCRARIRELRDAGCAIVFVTHSIDQVREMCDRVLWLRHGEVAALGPAAEVAEAYETAMREESLRRTPAAPPVRLPDGRRLKARKNRFGTLDVSLERVTLLPGGSLRSGDPFEVEIHYHALQPVEGAVFVVSITRQDGILCLDTNTQGARVPVPVLHGRGSLRFRSDRLDLGGGRYFVNVGVFETHWSHAYDYHWNVYPLTVTGPAGHKAILAPPCRWLMDSASVGKPAPAPSAALHA